jgi:ABC-type multidrug transport system fused ATPase/permease subunit
MSATASLAFEERAAGRYFYLWMAGAFILVAFGGFVPTYWAPVVAGTFRAPPIIHVHGMLMFAWTLFYFSQTALVATGRTMDHRSWGLAGISLFTVIACAILVGQMAVLKHNDALGTGDAARRFSAVTLCAWPVMVSLFTLAIVNIKRPEVHKRLMVLLMAAMMTPAIARVFLTFLAPPGAAAAGPPPPFVSIPPALVADLFIVVAIVRDWRKFGRPHPVYLYGGAVLLAQQVLTVPFAATPTWMAIARAYESLAG